MYKRLLALVLAVTMVITGLDTTALAAGQDGDTTKNTNVESNVGAPVVEGSNSVGAILANALSTEQSEQATDNGNCIMAVEMTGKSARVEYVTTEPSTLVVGIYDNAGQQLIATGTAEVSADVRETVVPIDTEEMPEYFYVKAFLIESDTLKPLCTVYENPNYTEEMQAFFAKTTDDFNPDKVYNLDDDKTNNFLVYEENVEQISTQGNVNQLVSADEENLVYVFGNIDDSIRSLAEGDIFTYGDENPLVIKVGSISIDGTTATITGVSAQMDEVFEFVKIDTSCEIVTPEEGTGEAEAQRYDATDYGIYGYNAGRNMVPGYAGGDYSTMGWGVEIDEGLEVTKEAVTKNISKEMPGGFEFEGTFQVTPGVGIKVYHDDYTYIELTVKMDIEVSATVKNGWDKEIYITEIPLAAAGVILVSLPLYFVFEVEGSVSLTGTLSTTTGLSYHSDTGVKWIKPAPEATIELKAEVTVFIGVRMALEVSVLKIVSVENNVDVGGEFVAAISKELTLLKEEEKVRHACVACIDGDINVKMKMGWKLRILGDPIEEDDLAEFTIKIGDFYYSFDTISGGMGECPNLEYKATIRFLDRDNEPAEGVLVDDKDLSDARGVVSYFLKPGEHKFDVHKDGYADKVTRVKITDTPVLKTVYLDQSMTIGDDYQEDIQEPDVEDEEKPVAGQKFKIFATGTTHSGAVTEDGSLYMWGDNQYGQLGDGTTTDSAVPIKIMEDVVAVDLGALNSAAVTEDGSLYIWGWNNYGILGNGTRENSSTPIKVMEDVIDVSLGGWHAGALTSDGSLYMWGNNSTGSVGNGGSLYADYLTPEKIMESVTDFCLGTHYSGAVTEDGSLYMWGANSSGQIGNGSISNVTVPIKILDNVVEVALGSCHTGAVTEDGSLYMWGLNGKGQIGDGESLNKVYSPVKVLENVVSIGLGAEHSGAITTDGSLYMWGDTKEGQLGDRYITDNTIPTKIMDGVKSICLYNNHSGAITTDGSLYTWGDNVNAQLGFGFPGEQSEPVEVMRGVVTTAAGGDHSAAVTEDGSLYMWGSNSIQQINSELDWNVYTPTKVMENIESVQLGEKHSGAVTKDGTLYMWGYDYSGQLGDGDRISNVPVGILEDVAELSLGENFSGAITEDGSLYMWGAGANGRLGNGGTSNCKEPVKIMDNVKHLELGMYGGGAITNDGSLYTWGYNAKGLVGNGTDENALEPVKILDNVVDVSIGGTRCGAVTEDGSLYMWGYNPGLDGIECDTYVLSPIKVMENVADVTIGENRGVVGMIMTDGSFYMWGDGVNVPTKRLENVKEADFGFFHYCVVTQDGTLYAWGENDCANVCPAVDPLYVPTKLVIKKYIDKVSDDNESSLANVVNAVMYASNGDNGTGDGDDGTTDDSDDNSTGTTDGNDGTGDGDDAMDNTPTPSTATFTDKIPGETYNFYVMKTRTGEGDAIPSNILYLDQVVADVDGKVSVSYIPREDCEGAKIFLSGRLGKYDFGNAVVTAKDQLYTGEELFADVTVTYEGKELTEGIDYELGGSYSATEPGEYTLIVTGTGEYKGSQTVTYHIRQFSLDVFGVIFDSNGGTAVETQEVEGGQCATEPETPTRENHRFKGWYLNGELYDFATPVTSHLELVAEWEEFAQLAAPKASIPNGSRVNVGTKVTLSAENTDAKIYYTVDETLPTTESSVYSTPIVIEKDVTIRAYAVLEGYYDSPVSAYEYTVIENGDSFDTVAPEDVPEEGIPEGIWIGKIADQTYTGKAVKPEIRVYDGTKRLVLGRDYTVSYKNNVKAQTDLTAKKVPTVVVKGKGNYSKTLTVPFKIQPLELNAETIIVDDVTVAYKGTVQKKTPTVYYGTKKLSKKDVEVSFVDASEGAYKELGIYNVKLVGTGNFAGERMVKLTVTDKTLMSSVKVAKVAGQPYQDGTAIEPTLDVTYKKKPLTKGTDYDVSYLNNKEIGTATAILTGKGNYAGVKRVNFKITGTPMKKVKIEGIKNQTYTGDAITQNLTLVHDGVTLPENAYTVEYANNTNVGTATVTIAGKGAFSGTVKKKFKITPYDLKEDTANVVDDVAQNFAVLYEKGGSKPSVDVVYKGNVLTAGKDYAISYKNNNAVTTEEMKNVPTFTIKGKGNFKGTLAGTFRINRKALDDTAAPVTIVADDIAYNGKAGKYVSKPVLTDSNGKTLKAGVDYEKDIVYTLKDGTALDKSSVVGLEEEIVVTVTGKGNYTGTISTTYKITELDFKKVKIKVSPQTYKGEAISLTKEDVEVTFGGVPLTFGEDYEIVEGSYKNNIRKGTASVTIKGKGSYGGSKTVKFKIIAKELKK